jgi:hypothetical protein
MVNIIHSETMGNIAWDSPSKTMIDVVQLLELSLGKYMHFVLQPLHSLLEKIISYKKQEIWQERKWLWSSAQGRNKMLSRNG